jgi:hypothetical protein
MFVDIISLCLLISSRRFSSQGPTARGIIGEFRLPVNQPLSLPCKTYKYAIYIHIYTQVVSIRYWDLGSYGRRSWSPSHGLP